MSEIVVRNQPPDLPPILAGHATPEMKSRVEQFFFSIPEIFEAWVARRSSAHTQRAYREDVLTFINFLGVSWPDEAMKMLSVSVRDAREYRDYMLESGKAPKTINRRISSVSSFYKYLAAVAAELRLPITIPNPAHAQFISRESSDPIKETKAFSATRARQLIALPQGESVIAYRDRAILKLYLYSGIRRATGCRLKVSDFHQDGDEATLNIKEKGNKHRTVGIHYAASQAIAEYIDKAGITSGPLFRPRVSHGEKLADTAMTDKTMYRIIQSYLDKLPGAMKDVELLDGSVVRRCIYTPHSIRASGGTLLLEAGVDITKVRDWFGHRHLATTQIYDKRRRTTAESASHDMPV
jgi:site-specific recombinase XerD